MAMTKKKVVSIRKPTLRSIQEKGMEMKNWKEGWRNDWPGLCFQ